MPEGVELLTAYVSIVTESSRIAPEVKRSFGQVGREADRAGKDSGKKFAGSFGSSVKGTLAGLGAGLGAAEVVGFLKDSISGASDLNETLSKSRVIFGKHADAVEKWGNTTATTIGLSKQQAIEARASFGDMFNQIGLGGGRATKMSKDVVQLAADLGSFNNLGTDDVLERIAGGFRGEYDALQKVIPNISAARVQQEALRRTHKKSAQDLTAAEKAEATLAIIRHDGARATGDFARTSGGLANQQKILGARVDDLKAKIGTGLLPVTTKIVSKVSDFVGEMQDGTGAGGDFVDFLEDARDVGAGVLKFFDSIPGPVKKYGIELAIAAVVLNKLNNGLIAGKANITDWVNGLGPADRKLTAVGKASYALGVGIRNLAGAGGMLALVDGAKRGGNALGYLETTAGGLATGFAVGGPVGAAVGGLAGGLFSIYKAATDAGDAAKDTGPDWKKYTETLDGVRAATSKQTRAMVLERLEKTGLLKQTQALNISDRDAVQAALGNEAARRRVSAALADTTTKATAYQRLNVAQRLGTETTAIYESRVAQLKKNLALAATKEEAQKIQAKLDRLARTNATPNITIGGYAKATQQLNAVLQLMHDISSSKGGVQGKTGGLDVLLNPKRRALGGPVAAGQPYVVGDGGRPELFVPDQNGQIIPRVPSLASVERSGVDAEQAVFRALNRAGLVGGQVVVMRKSSLEDLQLIVGA